mmetsp:Transcript_3757/g.9846  ORF Transcript_3757/g.9846 Transcript_3757/m.9846 type:complete len:288 (+) Transcript_3757:46-909(+)
MLAHYITFGVILLLYYNSFSATYSVSAFEPTCRKRAALAEHSSNRSGESGRPVSFLPAVNSDDGGYFYDDNLITAASKKLDWEVSEQRSQKPILNLSLRDASPEELYISVDDDDDASKWNQGHRWNITVEYLSELGVFDTEDISSATETSPLPTISTRSLVEKCPQLFRLDPATIQETAQWIVDEFGISFLRAAIIRDNNPILLSFRKEDAAYGLEFMSTMMMTDAKPACAASSAFLMEAIRGGIQERAVSAALGAASSATSKASRSIASDTMESFRQLRDANRHKK